MAHYTPKYQLHQWEPSDSFLRTDFNEDFAKIEAGLLDACTQTADASGWLEDALARTGYEALQTRIAAGAEGKTIPAGRALLFDSLSTTDQVTLTGGFGLKNDGGVLLDTGTGQGSFEVDFGTALCRGYSDGEGISQAQKTFTAAGNGTLNSITLNLRTSSNGGGATLSVFEGTKTLWSGNKTVTNTAAAEPYVYTINAPLKKGLVYTVRVARTGNYLYMHFADGGSYFGYKAVCTAVRGTSGTITSTALTADAFRAARAWVRHTGGTITCALQRGSGAYQSLTRLGSRATVNCRGAACTETEFRLPPGAAVGGAARFRVTVQSSTDATVHDFGALLI